MSNGTGPDPAELAGLADLLADYPLPDELLRGAGATSTRR